MAIASNSRARLGRGGAGQAALLLAVGLTLNVGAHSAATAAEEVFTVANYPVEARADNAVTAKTKAMADGQQAALRSLLKRLVPVTAYQRLRQLPPFPAMQGHRWPGPQRWRSACQPLCQRCGAGRPGDRAAI